MQRAGHQQYRPRHLHGDPLLRRGELDLSQGKVQNYLTAAGQGLTFGYNGRNDHPSDGRVDGEEARW